MDEKLTDEELQQRLDAASPQAEVGALYKHYKGRLYKVLDLAILESSNEVCVIYQPQYGARLPFVRALSIWVEDVEFEGKAMKRFARV